MATPKKKSPTGTRMYHVGIYMRVSREDKQQGASSGTESLSIENQKEMLSQFVSHMPNWLETRYYIDDGVSGGSFNRKGFQDMIEDVRAGIINLVLVKDLSRFGRNYLEAGKYLEEILPSLNCRFVAIADNIDTENGENDILPFLNAINDFYLKDVSQRIRSVMKVKATEGHKLTGSPPYGYQRKPDERHRLIIDAVASKVVRQVYELRLQGCSYNNIAATLNKAGIKPPRATIWGLRTIKLMLQNEVYIGNTISLQRGTRSHRDNRKYKRDESEWVRVENTHLPVIDREDWEEVQLINRSAKATYGTSGEVTHSLFSGLLICPDCGAKMGSSNGTGKLSDGSVALYRGYFCRTYYRSGKAVCSTHYISERVLKEIVATHIKDMVTSLQLNENRMVEQLKKKLIQGYKSNKASAQKHRSELEQKLYSLENQIDLLFEDKVEGTISGDTFREQISLIEPKRLELEIQLKELVLSDDKTDEKVSDINTWVQLIQEKAKHPEVDRELLLSLIDKIEVGDRVTVNGQTSQDIRIFYKFVGLVPN